MFVCFFKKKKQDFIFLVSEVFAGRGRPGGRRPLLAGNEWVLQDHDDQIPIWEHLGVVAVLVDRLGLLALASLGGLGPQLLHIL